MKLWRTLLGEKRLQVLRSTVEEVINTDDLSAHE
jgi:hypothetical protein